MDLLHEHAAEIEENVFFHTANLFNLTVDLIFYERPPPRSTSTTKVGERHANATLRKFGHSKEGTWSPQVVVALADPRRHPGANLGVAGQHRHVSTIDQIRTDLRGWKLGRALFVADSGMNSEDNRSQLARAAASIFWPPDGQRRPDPP